MNYWMLAAAVLLVTWGVLVFGVAPATGWVHVLLAIGTVVLARGLMGKERRP